MASANHYPNFHTEPDAREPRDARRRRELIEATIESIARNGLSGTTIAKVAEIANLSAGIVSFYFRTKDALLLATLEHIDSAFERRRLEVLDRAGDDPVRQLEAMIEVYFDPAVSDAGRVAVWAAFWGEARARESYQRVCGARHACEEDQLVALFEEVANQGGYDHIDPSALGSAFHHLLSSLPEAMLEDGRCFDYEKAKSTCRSFLASIFPAEFSRAGVAKSGTARDPRPAGASSELPAETLPAWVYRNPEFYELEREQIFKRGWLMVGHKSQAPNPGDYMTLDAVGERAVVIRGKDGVLRAFHNVCRHRASRVVRDETGNCPGAIVCPYHGWSYGFDGRLRGVPAEETFARLDKEKMGLIELELEQWMGVVFVRFGGDGPSVASAMQGFEEEARLYRIEEMKPWGKPISLIENFNWKFFVENDSEGYHIPKGHPGLRRLFGATYADSEPGSAGTRSCAMLQERESTHWTERAYQRLLPQVAHLPESHRRSWVYYGLFPSVAFQVAPDRVDCYQVLPLGSGQCRIHGFTVALEDDRREMRAARYLNQRLTRQIFKEDLDFCYWTDAGVRTDGYPGGLLSELESGVRKFQDRVRKLLPVAGCAEAPSNDRVAAVNDEMKREH